MTESTPSGGGWAGKAILVLVVWVALAGGAYWLLAGRSKPAATTAPPTPGTAPTSAADTPTPGPAVVTFGVAYGTEKERWLKDAALAFADTPDGKRYRPDLIPMGSLEGAQAVLRGDERVAVWSPASSMYRGVFEEDWRLQPPAGATAAEPVASERALALTPMVFVMWGERYDAFAAKYGEPTFDSLAAALAEKGGWAAIADKPDFGFFKFGHTDPGKSNSGLVTLVLMAYDHLGKSDGLTVGDVTTPAFQTWLGDFERAASTRIASTGTLMKQMVLRGPGEYDGVMVYESVAIDYLKNAEGRWGRLAIAYPRRNLWNDNPYYVLDVPWSTAEQRAGAEAFGAFLMTPEVQKRALDHGFRPGDPSVPITGPAAPDSPFTKYEDYGLRVALPGLARNPAPAVLTTLLTGWQRSTGSR